MNKKEILSDTQLPLYDVEEVSAAELIAYMKRTATPARESTVVRALERLDALSKRDMTRH
ncbi:MAG: hypothetical protein ABW101_13025 [Candidatus Thiodiazotropha sp.]